MENNSIQLLRAVKGAPLSILIAFLIVPGPLGHDYLTQMTGYSKDSVTTGLQVLKGMGLINPIPGKRYCGWMLSASALQLELFSSSPKIQDSNAPTTTTALIDVNIDKSSSSNENEGEKLGLEKQDVLKELHKAGIYGKTAIQLAGMEHITTEYVIAHRMKARIEHKPVNLLIHRMREKDPMPEDDDGYVPISETKYAWALDK